MGIKETIAKVVDKDTSSARKIQTLFREQGIMIASILTAIAILVEVLLVGGVAMQGKVGGGNGKQRKMKKWLRNKLKALARLLWRFGMKMEEALPGIIGEIISWILNRAKEVVGRVSQNIWVLVIGVGGLLYTYMVTKSNVVSIMEMTFSFPSTTRLLQSQPCSKQ